MTAILATTNPWHAVDRTGTDTATPVNGVHQLCPCLLLHITPMKLDTWVLILPQERDLTRMTSVVCSDSSSTAHQHHFSVCFHFLGKHG